MRTRKQTTPAGTVVRVSTSGLRNDMVWLALSPRNGGCTAANLTIKQAERHIENVTAALDEAKRRT